MKYFFLLDTNGKRHVVIARNYIGAAEVIEKAGLQSNDLYELTSETFNEPGFLISDK